MRFTFYHGQSSQFIVARTSCNRCEKICQSKIQKSCRSVFVRLFQYCTWSRMHNLRPVQFSLYVNAYTYGWNRTGWGWECISSIFGLKYWNYCHSNVSSFNSKWQRYIQKHCPRSIGTFIFQHHRNLDFLPNPNV